MFLSSQIANKICILILSISVVVSPNHVQAEVIATGLHKAFTSAADKLVPAMGAEHETNEQVNTPPCAASNPSSPWWCMQKVLTYAELGLMAYTLYTMVSSKNSSECKGSECYRDPAGVTTTTLGPGGAPGIDDSSTVQQIDILLNPTGLTYDGLMKEINSGVAEMKAKGYSYDAKTGVITTPNGKLNAESLNSAAGMKAAGFSDAQVAAALAGQEKQKAAFDKAYDDILKKFGMDEGDFAGGGGSARGGRGSEGGFKLNTFAQQKTKATIIGLSKSDGKGGQIGVAGDDMFGMIHRRYQEQRSQKLFHEKP